MVDKRPFVDRRLGFTILFKGSTSDVDPDLMKEFVNQSLEVTRHRVHVSKATGKNDPPQAKLILNEAHINPDGMETTISTIENVLEDDMGMSIQTIEIAAFALSPGDKVRNAIGT